MRWRYLPGASRWRRAGCPRLHHWRIWSRSDAECIGGHSRVEQQSGVGRRVHVPPLEVQIQVHDIERMPIPTRKQRKLERVHASRMWQRNSCAQLFHSFDGGIRPMKSVLCTEIDPIEGCLRFVRCPADMGILPGAKRNEA